MSDEIKSSSENPEEDRDRVASLLTTYTKGGAQGLNEIRMFLTTRSPDPELLEWLCMGFYTNGLYAECVEVCDEIAKNDPNNIKSLFYRANSQFHLENLDQARAGWQKVIDIDPNSHMAHKSRERIEGKRLPKRITLPPADAS